MYLCPQVYLFFSLLVYLHKGLWVWMSVMAILEFFIYLFIGLFVLIFK